LPDKVKVWQYVESVIRKITVNYGFDEIRFPTFESTELFTRSVGGTTDIVQKEMYTFNDRDKRSLSLRPEGTACVVRSIIENGLVFNAMPLKLYYIANFFRHEKAQKGRSREFWQFGIEIFGSDSPSADATAIMLANSVFTALGVKDVKLHLNSIGCDECRPAYREKLVEYLTANSEALCPICKERLQTNPLRVLDCKIDSCKKVSENAPKSTDHLCSDCDEHFKQLQQLLTECGVDFVIDTNIVRGLDYYTKTVFEFIDESIGAQSTVCGGGRYSKLVEILGGPKTDAVGFGMGITRLLAAMENSGSIPELKSAPKLYIAPIGNRAKQKAFILTEVLRANKIYAECDLCNRSVKAQMKYADKIGAEAVIVMGDNELDIGKAQIKNMQTGESKETELTSEALINLLNF